MRRLLFAVALVALAACDATDPTADRPRTEPRPLSKAEAQLVAADNAFTFGLLKEVVADDPDANVFLSPLSASMALGMTMNGARGDTRAAMEAALGKTGMTPEEINTGYRGLIDHLPYLDPKVTLTLANSIFVRQGFAVESAFLDANTRYFDATAEVLDFSNAVRAARHMNRWASQHTNGRIDAIMKPEMVTDDLVMTLMNAIYFKAAWKYAFDPRDTRDERFTRRDGSTRPVTMMRLPEATLPHYRGDGFQALDLPYGDSLYALTVLLPDAGRDVNALVAALDAEAWAGVLDGLAPQNVEVGLPRLKLTYSAFLNDPLKRLGMGLAFTGAADFRGISRTGNLFISFVKQDAFVEMNEKGTEAAAVTVVGIEVTSVPPPPPRFVADRPYVVVLRERTTGAILFAGRILDPGA